MPENKTRQTYRFECWRAISSGILETAASTFLLLIAVRWLDAGASAKAMVAGAGSVGLLLSPVIVAYATFFGRPTSVVASQLLAVGAVSFAVAACFPVLVVFVPCVVVAMTASAAIIPLLTQMYQENYPERERGGRFARTVMIRVATAVIFAKIAGDILTAHPGQFRWLLALFALALGFASFCLSRCPTRPLVREHKFDFLRGIRYVRQDALFRHTLICWMLMGFGNLMMLPLRVEYLANPKYGMMLTAGSIALFTGVIPNIARLALSPVWGYLFDRMNFFALRATLNVGFAIAILSFFMSNSWPGLICGAVVFGISNAGGDVAWSLWVTKFAPPDRVADYMSVHTFLTGVRGVVAPVIAFYAVNHASPGVLAIISAALILAASAMLVPEIRAKSLGRRSSALVPEEIAE